MCNPLIYSVAHAFICYWKTGFKNSQKSIQNGVKAYCWYHCLYNQICHVSFSDESENSKLFQFSVSEVWCCLNITNFKTPVLTETDAGHLPGSEIIDRTSVSK